MYAQFLFFMTLDFNQSPLHHILFSAATSSCKCVSISIRIEEAKDITQCIIINVDWKVISHACSLVPKKEYQYREASKQNQGNNDDEDHFWYRLIYTIDAASCRL